MIVYTQGTFDLFHYGHANILEKCRRMAGTTGLVVVALLTDEAIEKYKGKKPIMNFEERSKTLISCQYVDSVVPSDNELTKKDIRYVNPDFVVVGSDWAKKDIYKQYNMTKEELDPLLVYVPYTESISTSELKKRIKDGIN